MSGDRLSGGEKRRTARDAGAARRRLPVLQAAAARAREPSTWAGVAAVAQALAVAVPQYAAALGVVTAIAGAVAIAQREGTGNATP
ncbi:MAG: hypothetical protein N2483_10255 [Burkholderiaceae bacterium]|nr:hypothetical protein [Burkholderiaceae bacterium]